jgi:hypothetical protein
MDERIQSLIDRQEILNCLHRYTRGVDRLDADLIRSAYHPGAVDDHGAFCGPVEEFVDWVIGYHSSRHRMQHHYVTNHSCELDGDVAHAETYFLFVGQNAAGTPTTLHGGRYVDKFERRNGEWRIACRVCISEWGGGLTDFDLPNPLPRTIPGVSARDKTDASYVRPLEPYAARPAAAG